MKTTRQPLASVAELVRGVTFSKSDAKDEAISGLIPVLRAGNIAADQLDLTNDLVFLAPSFVSKSQVLRRNDIVMCMSSGSAAVLGKCGIMEAPWQGTFGAFLATVRPNETKCSPRYLYHYFRTDEFRRWASSSSGIGIKNIRASDLQAYEIPLPPLEEQKRIAAILDQADALRRLRARALDRLNAFGQAIFHEMFGRSSQAPLKRVCDFAEVKGGKRLPKGTDYAEEVTAHPYIRVSDLGDMKIGTSAIKYISPDVQKSVWRYTVSKGDLVISIAGSIGIVAPVPDNLDGANLTENAAKITPKRGKHFDPTYLAWALSTPEAKSQILASTGQVTIGKLALFRIEQIEVPMPDIDRQKQFARALEQANAYFETLENSQAKFAALFTSLQHRAFAGQL